MDAAQQTKGTTENADESDDPDSGSNRYSNEKRKGRFLIEEIEEENQIQNNDIYNDACDLSINDQINYSFNLKKHNLVINTIEYFGEIQNDNEACAEQQIISFLFDNNTNNFVPTELIFKNFKKSNVIFNYLDLYPHLYSEDCTDCLTACNFINPDEEKTHSRLFDPYIINNEPRICTENVNDNYISTVNIDEIKKTKLDQVETNKLAQTEKTFEKIFEKYNSDKHNIKRHDKNRLCLSKINSNSSVTNEYAMLTAYPRKNFSYPQSCNFHSNHRKHRSIFKKYSSQDINFSLIKEEKKYVSPKITPIRNRFSLDDKPNQFKASTKSPILLKNYTSVASIRSIANHKQKLPRKYPVKSFDNHFFKKRYNVNVNAFSKRHYSDDFLGVLDDNKIKLNSKLRKNSEIPFSIQQENIQILASENTLKKQTLIIENSISLSFSYSNSEKVCVNCTCR